MDLEQTGLPPYAYDEVTPGEEAGTSRITVTPAMVAAYWEAMPPSLRRSGASPLAIWDQETMNLVTDRWAIGGALQARTTWHLERVVSAGEEVTISVRIDDRFERRGRGVIRVRAEAEVSGEPVGWMEHEHVVALP
jgi:hypothetical protein